MIDYSLYLVTDDPSRYRGDWLENVDAAIAGGVTCVQFRDTESDGRARWQRASALRELLRARGVPLVVNDDAALAAALDAEGIHVGQRDLPPEAVRRVVGARAEIGLSITGFSQLAELAEREARFVDVIGAGPVFDARATKANAADAMGTEGFARIVEAAGAMRTVAIGGITLERAGAVLDAGAAGIAVVSAISRAADPRAAAAKLRALVDARIRATFRRRSGEGAEA